MCPRSGRSLSANPKAASLRAQSTKRTLHGGNATRPPRHPHRFVPSRSASEKSMGTRRHLAHRPSPRATIELLHYTTSSVIAVSVVRVTRRSHFDIVRGRIDWGCPHVGDTVRGDDDNACSEPIPSYVDRPSHPRESFVYMHVHACS